MLPASDTLSRRIDNTLPCDEASWPNRRQTSATVRVSADGGYQVVEPDAHI